MKESFVSFIFSDRHFCKSDDPIESQKNKKKKKKLQLEIKKLKKTFVKNLLKIKMIYVTPSSQKYTFFKTKHFDQVKESRKREVKNLIYTDTEKKKKVEK